MQLILYNIIISYWTTNSCVYLVMTNETVFFIYFNIHLAIGIAIVNILLTTKTRRAQFAYLSPLPILRMVYDFYIIRV